MLTDEEEEINSLLDAQDEREDCEDEDGDDWDPDGDWNYPDEDDEEEIDDFGEGYQI